MFLVRAERARWRLTGAAHASAEPIRRALGAAGRGALSPGGEDWMEAIEALRQRLQATEDELSVIDYGAGSSTATLSEEEMAEGRRVRLTVAEACAASKPRRWALLLFHLIRELRPEVCIEMGTAVGISAAYQATALRMNGRGRLITLEGARPLAELAARNMTALGLDNVRVVQGRFQDTLEEALRNNAPADYVFVDGHHDEEATLRYFARARPHLSPGALLVFDDIRWSPGMARAWSAIRRSPHTELAVDLGAMGLCVVRDRETETS